MTGHGSHSSWPGQPPARPDGPFAEPVTQADDRGLVPGATAGDHAKKKSRKRTLPGFELSQLAGGPDPAAGPLGYGSSAPPQRESRRVVLAVDDGFGHLDLRLDAGLRHHDDALRLR